MAGLVDGTRPSADDDDVLEDEEEQCPRCKTQRAFRPGMTLFTSPCGHVICDTCLENLAFNRARLECPTCTRTFRKDEYKKKVFSSGVVHKEVLVRKNELKDFNLTLDDFNGNHDEYNNYLEMVEDFAFNLTNDIDVKSTREQMKQFIQEHRQQIERNKRKKEEARKIQRAQLKARLIEAEKRRKQLEEERQRQEQEKLTRKAKLLAGLASASDPRQFIEQRRQQRQKERGSSQPVTQQKITKPETVQYDAPAPLQTGSRFVYASQVGDTRGPAVPATPLLVQQRYGEFVPAQSYPGAAAAGFSQDMVAKRALQEAYCYLFA